MSAGIEGSSYERCEDWTLWQYRELKAHWSAHPPLHVSIMFVGAALGVDWEKVRDRMTFAEAPQLELTPLHGPSVAELTAGITPPRDMGGTLAASIEALKRLSPPPQD